jgi:hypothetical protein
MKNDGGDTTIMTMMTTDIYPKRKRNDFIMRCDSDGNATSHCKVCYNTIAHWMCFKSIKPIHNNGN